MTKNVGKTDKIIRIAAAVIIAGAGIYFQSWLGLLALIPLGTAFMGWCPLYVPLGINTGGK
ncbi:MAG: DUF2892 domain-containing protein [Spirochaetae bacterium HGW-Spirochaetae-1]|jgi:hypothetical protein|nr:MAG: DUF2892 domain-containing protein [Spirochaetae bacterium HGW-Spirochaetae-1]